MNDHQKDKEHKKKTPHLCKLLKDGMMEQIHLCSSSPRFICCKCGAKANLAEHLCQPRPL